VYSCNRIRESVAGVENVKMATTNSVKVVRRSAHVFASNARTFHALTSFREIPTC